MKTSKWFITFIIVFTLSSTGAMSAFAYTWKHVQIGGGGYVTGLLTHPHDDELIYTRTDVGGAYRWDHTNNSWMPLLDEFEDKNFYSVEAMAIDDSDSAAKKLYMAVGRATGSTADIIRSSDQGKPGTWIETGLPATVDISGNADFRWSGDRLAMDPNRPGRFFYGTRQDGLWKNNSIDTSTNTNSKWVQITTAPYGTGTAKTREGTDKVGITFVVFDTSGGVNGSGSTKNVYIGVFGDGVYKSVDAGNTFTAVAGSPLFPVQGKADGSGNLYVTYVDNKDANANYNGGGVAKWSGSAWSDITPGAVSQPYAGIDIDRNDPNRIIVAARVTSSSSNDIYLSNDGGMTWSSSKTPNKGSANFPVSSVPWWSDTLFGSAIAAVAFAPTSGKPDRVWFTDWYGIWSTNDITSSSSTIIWNNYEQGHEEVAAFDIKSPASAGTGTAVLFSGVADMAGFRHTDLDAFPNRADIMPPSVSGGGLEITSYDVYEGDNNIVYMVQYSPHAPSGNGYRSVDNGLTVSLSFDPIADPVLPDALQGGKIAVSAIDSQRIVWLPINSTPYTSADGGASWTAATGITATNWVSAATDSNSSLAANKTGTNIFYMYHPKRGFYVSNTGATAGETFSQVTGSGIPTGVAAFNRYSMKSVPGQDGGLWIALSGAGTANDGLYQSNNYGSSFTKLLNVQEAEHVSFGKAAPGSIHPAAIYMYGRANGDTEKWLYRSDDMGATWIIINDSAHRFGSGVRVLEADRSVYGRVYVGASGRGIYYGEP